MDKIIIALVLFVLFIFKINGEKEESGKKTVLKKLSLYKKFYTEAKDKTQNSKSWKLATESKLHLLIEDDVEFPLDKADKGLLDNQDAEINRNIKGVKRFTHFKTGSIFGKNHKTEEQFYRTKVKDSNHNKNVIQLYNTVIRHKRRNRKKHQVKATNKIKIERKIKNKKLLKMPIRSDVSWESAEKPLNPESNYISNLGQKAMSGDKVKNGCPQSLKPNFAVKSLHSNESVVYDDNAQVDDSSFLSLTDPFGLQKLSSYRSQAPNLVSSEKVINTNNTSDTTSNTNNSMNRNNTSDMSLGLSTDAINMSTTASEKQNHIGVSIEIVIKSEGLVTSSNTSPGTIKSFISEKPNSREIPPADISVSNGAQTCSGNPLSTEHFSINNKSSKLKANETKQSKPLTVKRDFTSNQDMTACELTTFEQYLNDIKDVFKGRQIIEISPNNAQQEGFTIGLPIKKGTTEDICVNIFNNPATEKEFIGSSASKDSIAEGGYSNLSKILSFTSPIISTTSLKSDNRNFVSLKSQLLDVNIGLVRTETTNQLLTSMLCPTQNKTDSNETSSLIKKPVDLIMQEILFGRGLIESPITIQDTTGTVPVEKEITDDPCISIFQNLKNFLQESKTAETNAKGGYNSFSKVEMHSLDHTMFPVEAYKSDNITISSPLLTTKLVENNNFAMSQITLTGSKDISTEINTLSQSITNINNNGSATDMHDPVNTTTFVENEVTESTASSRDQTKFDSKLRYEPKTTEISSTENEEVSSQIESSDSEVLFTTQSVGKHDDLEYCLELIKQAHVSTSNSDKLLLEDSRLTHPINQKNLLNSFQLKSVKKAHTLNLCIPTPSKALKVEYKFFTDVSLQKESPDSIYNANCKDKLSNGQKHTLSFVSGTPRTLKPTETKINKFMVKLTNKTKTLLQPDAKIKSPSIVLSHEEPKKPMTTAQPLLKRIFGLTTSSYAAALHQHVADCEETEPKTQKVYPVRHKGGDKGNHYYHHGKEPPKVVKQVTTHSKSRNKFVSTNNETINSPVNKNSNSNGLHDLDETFNNSYNNTNDFQFPAFDESNYTNNFKSIINNSHESESNRSFINLTSNKNPFSNPGAKECGEDIKEILPQITRRLKRGFTKQNKLIEKTKGFHS